METNSEEPTNLELVSEKLGISYVATRLMCEFGAVNETEVLKDLCNGLLFEWLSFINFYTDSNINDFEEIIVKLFLDNLSDNIIVDLSSEELERMIEDRTYAGTIQVVNLDNQENEMSRIPIRLTLNQYINFLEIGIK
jgi:hypothetical protein